MMSLMSLRKTVQKARLYFRVGIKGANLKRIYVMIRYWIVTRLLKKEIPWLLELSVTYRCQCSCSHCSVSMYFKEARKKPELSTEQIKDILSQAVKIGIPKVDFFGGEPLLRKDIVELVQFGSCLGLYISLTTNAVSLTKEKIKELKRAGIACINISLDSSDETEHDKGRGVKGLWKKAVEGIKNCHETGVTCIASTFVVRDWIKNFGAGKNDNSHLRKVINFTREIQASGLRILFPIISGEFTNTEQFGFTDEEKKQVIENLDYSFAFIEGAYSVVKNTKVCQALSGKIVNMSPYGDIQLCSAFTDTFGNINEKPLRALIYTMWSHPIFLLNKNGSCCNNVNLRRNA